MKSILPVALVFAAAAGTLRCSGEPDSKPADAAAAGANISRLLPEASDVRPWTLTDRRLSYDASTLSDFIDGAADTYLDYGFTRVVSQEYASGSESVTCSVYEMRDAEAAFGIFSSLRSERKRHLDVGDDGFRAAAQLGFWQARYYVTVEAASPGGIGDPALETFARAIASRVGTHSRPPPVMSRLPRQGLRPSTERLLKGRSAADALAALARAPGGSLQITGATVLSGDYETTSGSYRLLVILAATTEGVAHARELPTRVFTPSAGYARVHSGMKEISVWTRQGRTFASQPIDGGVRLVVDVTRWEQAQAALAEDARK